MDTHNSNPTPPSGSQSLPPSPKVQRRQEFHDARTKFRSLRKDYERRAADGRIFVLANPLTAELRRTGIMDDMRESANKVVNPTGIPTVWKNGLPEYTIVFCILVEIGFPLLYGVFRNDRVDDTRLPLAKDRLERLVSQQHRKIPGFVQSFLAEQVAWCPISFSFGMSLDQHNRIEPFCHQSRIRSSRGNRILPANNASLFEVHIPGNLLPEDTCRTLDELGACIAPNPEPETETTGEPGVNDGKVCC
ncbi:hypothetical protein IMZ48_27985, partial [Candidatus Bathyarchaeota archaeon]|nr:hypothetical protein [Candidatus Bathyarchaeota archaeon]